MKELRINHLAVWILVILHQVVGFIWYSPALFGNKWMELLGKTAADFAMGSVVGYVVSFITAIVMTYFLAMIFVKLHVTSLVKGIAYALVISISFYFMQTLTQGLFSIRPLGLTFIDGGMYIANFVIAGAVLGAWKWYKK